MVTQIKLIGAYGMRINKVWKRITVWEVGHRIIKIERIQKDVRRMM